MLEQLFLRLYIYLANLKDCVISLLCSKRASAKLPKHVLDELARCFLPDILAYFASPEGREEYEERKISQTQQPPRTPRSTPEPNRQ